MEINYIYNINKNINNKVNSKNYKWIIKLIVLKILIIKTFHLLMNQNKLIKKLQVMNND